MSAVMPQTDPFAAALAASLANHMRELGKGITAAGQQATREAQVRINAGEGAAVVADAVRSNADAAERYGTHTAEEIQDARSTAGLIEQQGQVARELPGVMLAPRDFSREEVTSGKLDVTRERTYQTTRRGRELTPIPATAQRRVEKASQAQSIPKTSTPPGLSPSVVTDPVRTQYSRARGECPDPPYRPGEACVLGTWYSIDDPKLSDLTVAGYSRWRENRGRMISAPGPVDEVVNTATWPFRRIAQHFTPRAPMPVAAVGPMPTAAQTTRRPRAMPMPANGACPPVPCR